ncbi:MAG: glycosyltransferase, partial [Candidatus Rokuibacteriota bacterium]
MKPLHVVHVLDSLQVGGTENGAANLIRALDGDDLRHTVVAMTISGPVADRLPRGVAVHCLGKRPGWDLRTVARLVALLRRLRPDVVHSRNWGAFDAVPAARLARVPVVIHGEHGREASDPGGLNARRNRLRRA